MYSKIEDVEVFKNRVSFYYSFSEDEHGCEGWDNDVFCIRLKGVSDMKVYDDDASEILEKFFSINLNDFCSEESTNCFELNEGVTIQEACKKLEALGIKNLREY